MNISLETARSLYQEAADYYTGKEPHISESSELRKIALAVFKSQQASILTHVCAHIFFILAQDSMIRQTERELKDPA